MNHSGHPRVSEATTTIMEEELTLQSLVGKMQGLHVKLAEKDAQIDRLTKQLDAASAWVLHA